MRAAVLVTSAYEGHPQIPHQPFAGWGAELLAELCSEHSHGFEVARLSMDRQLPANLLTHLAQTNASSDLFAYFGGYVTMNPDKGPALLLEGNRLKALPCSKLRATLLSAARRALIVLDATVMPGTHGGFRDIADAIGAALVHSDDPISALVALRPSSPEHGGYPHFTDLMVVVTRFLSANSPPGTAIGAGEILDAMRAERASFSRLEQVSHFQGLFSVPLLEATGIPQPSLPLRAGDTDRPPPVSLYPSQPPQAAAVEALVDRALDAAAAFPAREPQAQHGAGGIPVARLTPPAGVPPVPDHRGVPNGPAQGSRPADLRSTRSGALVVPAPPPLPAAIDPTWMAAPTDSDPFAPLRDSAPTAASPDVTDERSANAPEADPGSHPAKAEPHAPAIRDGGASPTPSRRDSDAVPDSIPPSIPSAAWSGSYSPYFDAPVGTDELEEPDADAPAPLTSRQPRATTLPPPPRRVSAPLPPPDAARRILPPALPSRSRTRSRPPRENPTTTEDMAPASLRELEATVHAHVAAADRRAAAGDPLAASEHLRRALALGALDPMAEAHVRSKLASVLLSQGKAAEAIEEAEHALSLDDDHPTARVSLIEMLRTYGEAPRLRSICQKRLETTKDRDEQIALLDVLATTDIEQGRFRDAVAWLERRLSLATAVGSLEQLREAYSALQDWNASIQVGERLAEYLTDVPAKKSATLYAAARIAATRAGDFGRALQLVEAAWTVTPEALESLLEATGWVRSAQEAQQLLGFHETLLSRIPSAIDAARFALRAAETYKQHLGDPPLAAHLLSSAVRRAPDVAALRIGLADALVAQGSLDLAEDQTRAALALSPMQPEPFAVLAKVAARKGHRDEAWRAASVATALGVDEPTVLELTREHASREPVVPIRTMAAADWQLVAQGTEEDPSLDRCLSSLAPAIAAAYAKSQGTRPDWMADAEELKLVQSATTLARATDWISSVFDLPRPRVWTGAGEAGIRLEAVPDVTLVIGRSLAARCNETEFVFLLGRQLALTRAEHLMPGLVGGVELAWHWFEACLSLTGTEPAPDNNPVATRRILGELRRHLADEALSELAGFAAIARGPLRTRLEAACRRSSFTATRAGLLACGDPAVAMGLCRQLPLAYTSPSEQATDAAHFAISTPLGELRRSLGVALQ